MRVRAVLLLALVLALVALPAARAGSVEEEIDNELMSDTEPESGANQTGSDAGVKTGVSDDQSRANSEWTAYEGTEAEFAVAASQGPVAYSVFRGGRISSTEFKLTFEVKCKGSASVAFMPTRQSSSVDAYELVLGDLGNTQSLLRLGTGSTGVVAGVSTASSELSETEFRPFWISLDQGQLSVGRGHEFLGELIFKTPNLVPTLGKSGFLSIGWASGADMCTFRYKGAATSCFHRAPEVYNFTTPAPTPAPVPTPCIVTDFDKPSEDDIKNKLCSTKCGKGSYKVYRRIIKKETNGGAECPADLEMTLDCNTHPCPLPCGVSEWSEWSQCSKQCDRGTKSRSRTIKYDSTANIDYSTCPTDLTETADCNTHCCPVDCAVDGWGSWSACTQKCGGGKQTRTRKVTRKDSCSGAACPELTETQDCNTEACPPTPTCYIGNWDKWSECTKTCGGGERTRTRIVNGTATDCPISDTKQTESCNTDPCPINCVVGNFVKDGTCTAECGTGWQTFRRAIITDRKHGGDECPYLSYTAPCNTQPCAPQCEVDDWTPVDWTKCTATCGGGTQNQTRTSAVKFLVPGNGGVYQRFGTTMVDAKTFEYKFEVRCSETALVSFMKTKTGATASAWELVIGNTSVGVRYGTGAATFVSSADANVCHAGVQEFASMWVTLATDSTSGVRTMAIGMGASAGAGQLLKTAVPSDLMLDASSLLVGFAAQAQTAHFRTFDPNCKFEHFQSRSCNTDECPVDCKMSDWSLEWSPCSAKCGGGTMKRTRSISIHPKNGGKLCPEDTETQTCNTQRCPCDYVSDWTPLTGYTPCTKTCGGGKQHRSRVIRPSGAYGEECPSNSYEEVDCNTHPCPVNCEMSPWFTDSTPIAQNYAVLPTLNGLFDKWLPFTIKNSDFLFTFKAKCSSGMDLVFSKTAASAQTSKDAYGINFDSLDSKTYIRVGPSNQAPLASSAAGVTCDANNMVDYWVQKTAGQLKVGTGAFYDVSVNPVTDDDKRKAAEAVSNGYRLLVWANVPTIVATDLNIGFASAAAQFSFVIPPASVPDTEGWTTCTAQCGGKGEQTRYRTISVHPKHNGTECPETTQKRACGLAPCNDRCKPYVGEWKAFSDCSAKCGKGKKTRTRIILPSPYNDCEKKTSETVDCEIKKCPVHCKTSAWGTWSKCDTVCGVGQSMRSRTIIVEPQNGGNKCGDLVQYQKCDMGRCTCDDVVGAWSSWGKCSEMCGYNGVQSRTRTITKNAVLAQGLTCPTNTMETRFCNQKPCPIDCKLGEWQEWSECTVSCGTGTRKSRRYVEQEALYGGKKCTGALVKYEQCNTDPCKPTCVSGDWSDWSSCPKKCTKPGMSPGIQFRLMKIGLVESLNMFLQSDCDDQSGKNLGNVQIGNTNNNLPNKNTLYVFNIDAAGKLTKESVALGTDSSLLQLAASTSSTAGVQIVVVHFGAGGAVPSMASLSTGNLEALAQLGTVSLAMPLDPTAASDLIQEQSTGWSYFFVRNQGEVLVDNLMSGCGSQTFSGSIQTKLAASNSDCPQTRRQEDVCGDVPCPIDCVTDTWSGWTECPQSCGGGTKSKSRSVLVEAENGGKECGEIYMETSCNTDPCPPSCQVGPWDNWTPCSAQCGGGWTERTRTITKLAGYAGTDCPTDTLEKVQCNTSPCPKPPVTQTCTGANCAPTPTTAAPACVNALPWVDVAATNNAYQQFDTTKVKSDEFSLKLDIKGCGGASIAFMTTQADSAPVNSYEVIIGGYGGTQSSISVGTKSSSPLATIQHAPFPKPCDVYEPFWITLKAGLLSVGKGDTPGASTFLSASVPKIVGDGCNCLHVGFAADDQKLRFRYSPPKKNCGGDQCAANTPELE